MLRTFDFIVCDREHACVRACMHACMHAGVRIFAGLSVYPPNSLLSLVLAYPSIPRGPASEGNHRSRTHKDASMIQTRAPPTCVCVCVRECVNVCARA
jgi:hypothetical protein